MGGSVSSGRSNDELIDNLVEADYIKSPLIERVFRAVDRAEYFLPEAWDSAYKELAWKAGNLHISSPCIYSEAMEALDLEPGLSFLNMGSGTGYFSTMVGLILGTNGINHGIEIHADVIDYADARLKNFKKLSGAIDEFDFCEPTFIHGNCLSFTSAFTPLYDRIYCGAGCPKEFKQYMQNRLKLGGILVLPLDDQLIRIKRLSVSRWKEYVLLPVSFASLVRPPKVFQDFMKPIEVAPLPLQMLCRSVIRNILRNNIEREHINDKNPSRMRIPKKMLRYKYSAELNERRLGSRDERTIFFFDEDLRRENQRILNKFLVLRERPIKGTERSRSNTSLHGEGLGTMEQVLNTETNEHGTEVSAYNHSRAKLSGAGRPSTSTRASNKNSNRQKWDSDLGDEIIETHESSDDESLGLDAIFSCDEDNVPEKRFKRGWSSEDEEDIGDSFNDTYDYEPNIRPENLALDPSDWGSEDEEDIADPSNDTYDYEPNIRSETLVLNPSDSSSGDEEGIADSPNDNISKIQSLYTPHMIQKIQELPLPLMIKKYLNYNRDMNIEDGD